MSNSERFLWVCELNKDQPAKIWKATDLTEDDDEDDQDYVLHSLVVKQAVLGKGAVDNERNIVSLKTKGFGEKEFEQPIFSLTLGRNDMISNMDLVISTRENQNVEFKLIDGTGPVFITCMHVLEVPIAEEGQTIMTCSDAEAEEDEDSEEVEEEMPEENGKSDLKNGKKKVVKNGVHKNGKANGKGGEDGEANGKANGKGGEDGEANGKANGKGGEDGEANGKEDDHEAIEADGEDDKPRNKRKRN